MAVLFVLIRCERLKGELKKLRGEQARSVSSSARFICKNDVIDIPLWQLSSRYRGRTRHPLGPMTDFPFLFSSNASQLEAMLQLIDLGDDDPDVQCVEFQPTVSALHSDDMN